MAVLACNILFYGKGNSMEEFHVEPKLHPIPILGIEIPETLITALLATCILIIGAIIVRVFIIPRFKDVPNRFQLLLEMSVDGIKAYTASQVGDKNSQSLSPYMFTIALFIVCNGVLELFGIRPAMTDINSTFALSLISFILIQAYAIRRKGLWGRIKSYGKPSIIIAPFKLIVDMATPISLACRMFGNILGGLVVMELLYGIGLLRWGIPGVLSIYFTVFHTLMQTFIFITLSLTFINEACE